ncbi:MAG TPA: TSUP family transporter [Steroidobacteraceae bacterium]|nr:TSUP family transporter [Steroidobacteraceae bacterium]
MAVPDFSFDLLLVLSAAFAAGLIDAMVGGGGLIQVPALFAVYPNVPPAALLGTSKFAGLFGTLSAVARYAQKVAIPWRALFPLALVALAMSVGGARLASIVAPDIFRPLVPVMLLAVLIYVLWRKDLGGEHAPRAFAGSHHVVGAALVAAIGLYDGFFGPGTGSLLIFVFVRCYGYDFLHAGAAARVVNVATNAAALSYFASHGLVLWYVGAAMAACNIAGAVVGARLALRGGSTFVRKAFIIIVSLLIMRTAWTALRG